MLARCTDRALDAGHILILPATVSYAIFKGSLDTAFMCCLFKDTRLHGYMQTDYDYAELKLRSPCSQM